MRKKADHLEALTRMLALAIAGGDENTADEFISWAYGPDKPEQKPKGRNTKAERTTRFINNELSPKSIITKEQKERFIKRYILRNASLDYNSICMHIRTMQYKDFLKTTYWAGIASYIKDRKGNRCERCGKPNTALHVHHTTYEHHGDELHNLADLECLCQYCHQETHNKQ